MLHFYKRPNAGVTSAGTNKVRLFVDTDGLVKTKDETGTLSTLAGLTSFNGRTGPVITPQQSDYDAFFLTPAEGTAAYQKISWYDVTLYGILPSNSAALNVTNWNALYSILPVNCVVYFPTGTYDFASELTLNRNIQMMTKGDGKSRTILRTTSATANLFYLSISAYYYSFEELGLKSTVTKTAGALIGTNAAAGDNAYLDIRRCEFQNYFFGIDLSGVGAANVGTISECLLNNPSPNATGIRINGANINNMLTNVTINQNSGAAGTGTCLQVLQSGAVQFVGCDFIGGQRTLLVNPTSPSVVSALYFTNCFFDQAGLSTVEFSGTGSTSRVKFIQCGITNGNVTNSTALAISGTGTGTGIPEALDFLLCDFYNSFGSGITTTGILLNGVRGIDVKDCRISGFTTGINITPVSANGVTNFNIQGCTVGPTENFPGNVTGVNINAGSFTYGPSNLSYNDFSGNTTALVNNGNFDLGVLQLIGNLGLSVAAIGKSNNALITVAATSTIIGTSVVIPANSARAGTSCRITGFASNAATINTNTLVVRCGPNNSNADPVVATLALTAGTAAAGFANIVAEFTFATTGAGTAVGYATIKALVTAGFAAAAGTQQVVGTLATLNTTQINYIGLYISPSAANVITTRSGCGEVITQ